MNGLAVLAYATPIAAVLIGWVGVELHRRSLARPGRAASGGGQDLDAQLAALQAQLDDTARGVAALRARLDDEARERARAKAGRGEVAAAG